MSTNQLPVIRPDAQSASQSLPVRFIRHVARRQATAVIVATLALLLFAAIAVPRTLMPASLVAILVPAAVIAIAAIGQTMVVQQKGIDLSVGGAITLAAVTLGVIADSGMPLWISLTVVGVLAILSGLFNGILITRFHITPILATLASNSLLIGVVWSVSGGSAQLAPEQIRAISVGSWLGFPFVAWIAVVLVALMAIVLSRTALGRRFTGVGASPAAARAGGAAVERHIVAAYIASSVFGAIAGVLLAGYAGQATFDLGSSYMLTVIAAVVIGGASLSGGRGSVVASAFGALLLSLVVQMVLTLGAPTSVQLLVQSLVLGLAAGVRLLPVAAIFRLGRR